VANWDECEKVGVDPKVVDRLARRLEKVCAEADKLGLTIFFGSHNSIRAKDEKSDSEGELILCNLAIRNAGGGAGYARHDDDGLMRGE
jgi:hypothetical protein